jgi:hypothetical protein
MGLFVVEENPEPGYLVVGLVNGMAVEGVLAVALPNGPEGLAEVGLLLGRL